jgi:hypothetical protein
MSTELTGRINACFSVCDYSLEIRKGSWEHGSNVEYLLHQYAGGPVFNPQHHKK